MKSATPARAKDDRYLAIEIGGTKLQVVAGTADGRFVDRRRFNVSAESGAEGIRAELSATLPALIAKHQPRAIGVGYGGPVNWRTALGNDYSYDDAFVGQLQNYARSGDVLLAASVGGNSPNLVKAFEWANDHGLETAAIVGAKRGRLAEIARQTIVIEDTHYGRVEDVQMHILHMLCYAFMEVPEMSRA